jgi:hypothetical protein
MGLVGGVWDRPELPGAGGSLLEPLPAAAAAWDAPWSKRLLLLL